MTVACIIQARMGSSRLPGKVMEDIGGKTVLRRVIDRVKRVRLVDVIVLTVPDEAQSEPLKEIAKASDIACVAGPELDVLSRFRLAADTVKSDYYMRITADCPFIDWAVCNQVISMALGTRADYCSNVPDNGRTFPRGLDCEVFTSLALNIASDVADSPYDREHVTPWIRRCTSNKHSLFSPEDLSGYTLTLDTASDLQYLRELYAAVSREEPTTQELIAALKKNPEILRTLSYNNVIEIHAA